MAFRRLDFTEAIRFARLLSDRDPVFSLMMLVQVNDALGTPVSRERSARAAETLASLTPEPGAKAATLLYAAETYRDLEWLQPEEFLKQTFAERRELDRSRARAALLKTQLWQTRLSEAKALLALHGIPVPQ